VMKSCSRTEGLTVRLDLRTLASAGPSSALSSPSPTGSTSASFGLTSPSGPSSLSGLEWSHSGSVLRPILIRFGLT
jgi:hypothetical protein